MKLRVVVHEARSNIVVLVQAYTVNQHSQKDPLSNYLTKKT